MKPEVYDYIIIHDPEILVDCAAEIRDQRERERLVKHILLQCEEEKSGSQRYLSGRGYRKLCHGTLGDQLQPLIKDRTSPPNARIRAIAIAHHCKVNDVLDALVEVALDGSDELAVRDCAVAVIAAFDHTAIKARLKGLALGAVDEDPLDALKGGALSAVWPDHITARELFETLTAPKQKNLIGGQYSGFLYSDVMRHLRFDHLPIALAWVRDQHRKNSVPSSFRELSDKIMALAWEHLNSPTVLESYAEAAIARLNMKCDEPYLDPEKAFKVFFGLDGDKRRLVTEAILPLAVKADTDTDLVTARLRDALLWNDFSWLIELLKNIEQEDIQRVLVRLVLRVFDRQDNEREAVLKSVARQCQPLSDELERRQHLLEARLQRRAKEDTVRGPDSEDMPHKLLWSQVEALLVECEAGNYGKFFDLAQYLISSARNFVGPDLTNCRFWRLAEPEMRDRILNAARHFVLCEDPVDYETGDERTADPDTSFVCYRILRLLFRLDRDLVIGGLPIGVWKKWAPTTITFPSTSVDHEFGLQALLVGLACSFAPGKLIEHVLRVIDRENEKLGDAPVVAKLGECGNAFVQDRLLEKLKEPQLQSKSFERLLHLLVGRFNRKAIELAESLLQSDSLKPEFTEKCLFAAKLLLSFNAEHSWPVLWEAMTRDKDFGREVIVQGFPRYYVQYEVFSQGLLPNQLADLFVWLHTEFPTSREQTTDHYPDEGDLTKLDEIKSYILSDLRDRGTPEALDALGHISSELPSERWIKKTLLEAEDRAIEMDREPLLPKQLLALVNHSRKRMVQSEAQLLDVVQESLEEFQKKLKGTLPSVRDLWDQDPNDKNFSRPVDEPDFSNRVARHLQNDLVNRGVVVNREVAIRRGEFTDIHIDAIPTGKTEDDKHLITVIIEVKGCWNKGLFTDMKDQLVDRYMKDNQCLHGLYLVGWFYCGKWHPDDDRSTRHAKEKRESTATQAQKKFDGQAEALSTGATTVKAFVLDASLL